MTVVEHWVTAVDEADTETIITIPKAVCGVLEFPLADGYFCDWCRDRRF